MLPARRRSVQRVVDIVRTAVRSRAFARAPAASRRARCDAGVGLAVRDVVLTRDEIRELIGEPARVDRDAGRHDADAVLRVGCRERQRRSAGAGPPSSERNFRLSELQPLAISAVMLRQDLAAERLDPLLLVAPDVVQVDPVEAQVGELLDLACGAPRGRTRSASGPGSPPAGRAWPSARSRAVSGCPAWGTSCRRWAIRSSRWRAPPRRSRPTTCGAAG